MALVVVSLRLKRGIWIGVSIHRQWLLRTFSLWEGELDFVAGSWGLIDGHMHPLGLVCMYVYSVAPRRKLAPSSIMYHRSITHCTARSAAGGGPPQQLGVEPALVRGGYARAAQVHGERT